MENNSAASPPHPNGSDPRNANKRVPQVSSWFPSIYILKPPKAPYSPHADERCITYCTQSARGRTEQAEPWCRSICIRRVFAHEVRRVLRTYTFPHPNLTTPTETEDKNLPLPPEGQDPRAILDGTFLGRVTSTPSPDDNDTPQDPFADDYDPLAAGPSNPRPAPGPRQTQLWKEGWYVWGSTSRWSIQEHMDKMTMPLDAQHAWERFKQRRNAEWARDAGTALPPDPASAPFAPHMPTHEPEWDENAAWTAHQNGALPYPSAVGQSVLLALPPPSPLPPLQAQIARLLRPARRALELTATSVQDGSQRELAGKVWDKAWTAEPWVLAGTMAKKVWKRWRDGKDDGEDDGGFDPE